MRFISKTFAALLLFQAFAPGVQSHNAMEILKKVDLFRNPPDSYSMNVDLMTVGRPASETWKLKVFGKGAEKCLVEYLAPVGESGKYLLMLREAMWIYIPDTSRPIRISPLQRLMGDVSNGDVARTSYAEDYNAEVAGEEKLDGQDALVLELKARDPDVSYGRVRLWVQKEGFAPMQAEYYVASGKLMKRVFFREFGTLENRRMVTVMEIQDAVRPKYKTMMKYSHLQARSVPEKMFNQSYLGRW